MKTIHSKSLFLLALFFNAWTNIQHVWAVDCLDPTTVETAADRQQCLLSGEQELLNNEEVSLPSGDITTDFIPFFINLGLSVAGTLVFITFVYAGYTLITANDAEDKIEKGKKMILYALIGLAIIATSYAIVFGIANLDVVNN